MRCFAVLGPSFSGKSALVDQLAALEGAGQASDSRAGVRLVKFGFGYLSIIGEHPVINCIIR